MGLTQPSLGVATAARAVVCPVCRGPLVTGASSSRCGACGVRYRRTGDVQLLRPPFSADGAMSSLWSARTSALIGDAEQVGWDEALRTLRRDVLSGPLGMPAGSPWARLRAKLTGTTWEDFLQEVVDATRAGWKFLLDLRPESRVLFLGPTWGAAPLALARTSLHVTVLDGSAERLRLVGLQAAASGIEHLTLACVRDPLRLPVPDGSIDVAVVPGVAQWVRATTNSPPKPGAVVVRLLEALGRVLVPGGQAYVGTANRTRAWRLLDAEAGKIATSPAELQAAAFSAGFRACRLVAPVPFRHKFHQVLDLEQPERMTFSPDPYRARGRVLRTLVRGWDACERLGGVKRELYRHLPAVSAVVSAGSARPSFAERLLEHLVATEGVPGDARLSRYCVRPKGVVVLTSATPAGGGTIVRLPLDERAADNCRRHYSGLATLARDARLSNGLRGLFPVPLATGTFEGQEYFAETILSGEAGVRYYGRSRRRYERAIGAAVDVLVRLRRVTETPVRIDDGEFDRLCGRWLAELATVVNDDGLGRTFDAIGTRLRRTLVGTTLPLGWAHGDLDFANLLYGRDDRVVGVLDFELFEPRGLPLLDQLVLLARWPIRRQRLPFGTIFTRSILPRALPPVEGALLARELRVLGADDALYRSLALCCWLNHLRLRRDSWLVRSPSWLQANLYAVVEDVKRVL